MSYSLIKATIRHRERDMGMGTNKEMTLHGKNNESCKRDKKRERKENERRCVLHTLGIRC